MFGSEVCLYLSMSHRSGFGVYIDFEPSLAYCEMYLVFAALFRRFDMELDMNGTR